jgi:hypothetical protein
MNDQECRLRRVSVAGSVPDLMTMLIRAVLPDAKTAA